MRDWKGFLQTAVPVAIMVAIVAWAFTLRDNPAVAPPPAASPTPAVAAAVAAEATATPGPPPPDFATISSVARPAVETDFAPVAKEIFPAFGFSYPRPPGAHFASDSGRDGMPRAAADGQGNWVVVFHSRDPLGGTIGDDYDVLAIRSGDGGRTWSDPVAVNSRAAIDEAPDGGVASGPDVATDGRGNWIAVWNSKDSMDGTIGDDEDVLVARSTDFGETWSESRAISNLAATDSGEDIRPRVASDAAGNWIVVWESTDPALGAGPDRDLFFARSTDDGIVWSDTRFLAPNATADAGVDKNPTIATDRGGVWLCLWESTEPSGGLGDDEDVFFARSTDAGESWQGPLALNADATEDFEFDGGPVVAGDGSGQWVAIWYSKNNPGNRYGDDADIFVSVSIDAAANWSSPVPLHDSFLNDSLGDYNPQLARRGSDWLCVWETLDAADANLGPDADLLVSRSTNGGFAWSPPQPLLVNAAQDAEGDHQPHLVADPGTGRWLAVWFTKEKLGGAPDPGPADFDLRIATSPGLDSPPE